MKRKKYSTFSKGDVILTSPESGFWGIAVVLDDGVKLEIEPGKWSYPMCHIAITPLLFDFIPTMEDVNISDLKPLVFNRYVALKGKPEFYYEELLVQIRTIRNVPDLPIIGKVNPDSIFQEPLSWKPQDDRFHLCGDIGSYFGREAYIDFERKKNNKSL